MYSSEQGAAMVCPDPHCKCEQTTTCEVSGGLLCAECYAVIEENQLVNSVEFSESAGSSSVVGQFVSANSTKPYSTTSGARGHMGNDRDGRETTITHGKKKICHIASQLNIPQKYVEAAHRLFRIAVCHKFVQGRKTYNVVAACLFIVVRQNDMPIMLIDISDAVGVNVFELGQTFLKLYSILNLKAALKIVDPALYITK
jgi:transcription factor IIIB 90 kDa subunit